MNPDKNDAMVDTLITSRRWDGNDGWGGVWGRASPYDRRVYVGSGIMGLIWLAAVIVGSIIAFG